MLHTTQLKGEKKAKRDRSSQYREMVGQSAHDVTNTLGGSITPTVSAEDKKNDQSALYNIRNTTTVTELMQNGRMKWENLIEH